MRRLALLLVILSLVISCAVPTGAVFASGESISEVVASNSNTTETVIEVEQVPEQSADQSPPSSAGEKVEPSVMQQSFAPEAESITMLPNSSTMQLNETEPIEAKITSSADTVVITEIQTRGASGATAELVEIYNASSTSIDVTGWCLQYAAAGADSSYRNSLCISSSDGLAATRVILPAQEYVVLVSNAVVTATPTFVHDGLLGAAMADSGGRLRLVDALNEVIDQVGWGAASEYQGSGPAPAIPTTLPLRSLQRNKSEGLYQNTRDNKSDFALTGAKTIYEAGALYEVTDICSNLLGIQEIVPNGYIGYSTGECRDRSTINFCDGVVIGELAANVTRQYIEVVNTSNATVSLDDCLVMTNRSTSTSAHLGATSLDPGARHTIYIDETPLKLTKSTAGTVYLLASDGETEIDAVPYEDLSSDTSWALFSDGWKQTYDLTPGTANLYAQFAACSVGQERSLETGRCKNIDTAVVTSVECEAGRERNPETNRCRNIVVASILKPCSEGQYRSEETNRCRSIVATLASVLKPCADDQFRNPTTNRCKKIASADEVALADCGEGRERNPETNRCRNVLGASTVAEAMPFPVEETPEGLERFTGWWVIGAVAALGAAYGIWEWRVELLGVGRKAGRFVTGKK